MAFPSVKSYSTLDPITSLTIPPIGAIFHTTQGDQGPARANWIYNFYLTGTGTAANVYTDGALTVPFSPTGQVTSDNYGRFPAIYLDNSVAYKVTLSNSGGGVQQTQDPYNPAMATTGFAQVAAAIGLMINTQGELTMTEAGSGGSGNELTVTAGQAGALKIQGITPGIATIVVDASATTGAHTATFEATNRPGNELQYTVIATAAPSGATYTGGTLTVAFPGVTASNYTIVLSTGQVITGATFTNASTAFTTPSTAIVGTPSATFIVTFTTGAAGWLPIQCDGVLYYTPIFHGNQFTPYVFKGFTYQGQTISAASVTFNGDGSVALTGSGASATPAVYYSPPQTGIGSSTWFNPTVTNNGGLTGATFIGGNAGVGANLAGTWTNIGSGFLTVSANMNSTLTGTYQLSTSGSGTPVVASGTISMVGSNGVVSQAWDSSSVGFLTNGTELTAGNWFLPTTTGIGSDFYFYATQSGGAGILGGSDGTLGGITQATWTSMASNINLYAFGGAVLGNYNISNTSGSAGVLASNSFEVGGSSTGPQPWDYGTSGTSFTFNTNGSTTGANWYAPTTTGIGSSYYLYVQVAGATGSAALTGITADTPTILSSVRTLGISGTGTLTLYWYITNSAASYVYAGGTIPLASSFTPVLHIYTNGLNATETIPAGATSVVIENWGGGGGGGYYYPTSLGGGGAAGGYCRTSMNVSSQNGKTFKYTTGGPGASQTNAGNPGNSGGSGTVTAGTVTGFTTMTANGGNGGEYATGASGGTATGGTAANATGASVAVHINAGATGTTGTVSGDGSPYGGGGTGGLNLSNSSGQPGLTGAVVFYYT